MNNHIPFNKPFIAGKELFYISQAVVDGKISGDGTFTKKCQNWMQERFDAKKVLLTHSCTAALEMSAILADIQPGDEVILPSYTFVSTANAFALRGAKLRFVDIREDTLNIDERLIEQAITPRTKAIVVVHYAGVAAEMDMILEIAKRHNLLVIEDAAQGVDATYKGKYLGTIGDLGTYSFHETKNYISGEGGALVINNEELMERSEIIWEKGTNRKKFFRGEIDKYTWVDIGSSFLPSEMIAAFLYAQLETSEHITEERLKIYHNYQSQLQHLEDAGLVRLPRVPEDRTHNAHMFYLILESSQQRAELIDFLKEDAIYSVFHYVPLHTSPMGRKLSASDAPLPVTEDLSERLLRLPCYYELTLEDQARIVSKVDAFFG